MGCAASAVERMSPVVGDVPSHGFRSTLEPHAVKAQPQHAGAAAGDVGRQDSVIGVEIASEPLQEVKQGASAPATSGVDALWLLCALAEQSRWHGAHSGDQLTISDLITALLERGCSADIAPKAAPAGATLDAAIVCSWATPVDTLIATLAHEFPPGSKANVWVDFVCLPRDADGSAALQGVRTAMSTAQRHIVVLDAANSALRDRWCLAQMDQAVRTNRKAVQRLADAGACGALPQRVQHALSTDSVTSSLEVSLSQPTASLHAVAEAVADLNVPDASSACPFWSAAAKRLCADRATAFDTTLALQNALFGAVRSAARSAQSSWSSCLAVGLAYSTCGRHADAEAPLRAALASMDTAAAVADTYAPPPCAELLVDERTITETSETSNSHGNLSALPRSTAGAHADVASLCPISDAADGASDDLEPPELPVSRRTSGYGECAALHVQSERAAGAGKCNDSALSALQQKLSSLALKPGTERAPPPDARVRARACYQLALSLYMQSSGFGHLPSSRAAPYAAVDAQHFACVAEAAHADCAQRGVASGRRRQLKEALRLLERAEGLYAALQSLKAAPHGACGTASVELARATAVDAQGRCLLALGDTAGALLRHGDALKQRCRHLEDSDVVTGISCYHIGAAMRQQGMCSTAATHLAAAFEIFGKHGPRAQQLRAAAARALAPALAAAGRASQGRGMLEVALQNAGRDASLRAAVLADSAGHAHGAERINALAASLHEAACALHREHPQVQRALSELLAALEQAGRQREAEAYQRHFCCAGPVLEVG